MGQHGAENNGLAGQKAHISVRDGSRILAARDVTLGAQAVQSEEVLFHSGDPGTRKLSIQVDPLPGEEVTGNNQLTRVVQVLPGRRRILYVEDNLSNVHLVERILDHVGVPMTRAEVARRFGSTAMDPTESHTFKKGGGGRIGGWRAHFRPEHVERFKAVAGRTLVDLGYETDLDWDVV